MADSQTSEYVAVSDLKVGDVIIDNPHISYTVKAITPWGFDYLKIDWEPGVTDQESFSNLRKTWIMKVAR